MNKKKEMKLSKESGISFVALLVAFLVPKNNNSSAFVRKKNNNNKLFGVIES